MNSKIVDLIRKLIAQSQSAKLIGSLEEAQAFAARAQALMDEYKVGMSDVEYSQYADEEPVSYSEYSGPEAYSGGSGKRQRWTLKLAEAIADANECEIVIGDGNRYCFVGRTSSREFCVMLFRYMFELAADLVDKSVDLNKDAQYAAFERWADDEGYYKDRKAGFRHWIKNYRKSWLNGFADAIEKRLNQQTQERNLKANPGAIVHISKDKQAVEEFMGSQKFAKVFTTGGRGSHRDAYDAGESTGSAVNLTPHTFGERRPQASRLLGG